MRRSLEIILRVAGGTVEGQPVDCWPQPANPPRIFLRQSRVAQIMGVDLPLPAIEKTLVAIKESSEDPRRITDIRNAVGDRFILFCGVDDLVMESFVLGATGWISGLVNAFPTESRRLWDLLTAGRFEDW